MNKENIRKIVTQIIDKKLPREELEEHIIEFLQSQNVCVLSTSKDNIPRATPIGYYSEGTTLYMIGEEGTKITNIKANPNVSVAIFAPYIGWLSAKGVQITGKAKIIEEGDSEHSHALQVYKWQKMNREIGLSEHDPPKKKIIKVVAEKIELEDYYLKICGYSDSQVWERRSE